MKRPSELLYASLAKIDALIFKVEYVSEYAITLTGTNKICRCELYLEYMISQMDGSITPESMIARDLFEHRKLGLEIKPTYPHSEDYVCNGELKAQ